MDSFKVFNLCSTCWRHLVIAAPTMVQVNYTGLDYLQVECVIRNEGFKGRDARRIFQEIRDYESGALEILNKKK